MGIRKEIERAQAEKRSEEEAIRQERLRVVGKINERINFLNEQARVRIRPYLRTLQESGAIEVLRELGAEINGPTEIGAWVSWSKGFYNLGGGFYVEDLEGGMKEYRDLDDVPYLTKREEKEAWKGFAPSHYCYDQSLESILEEWFSVKPRRFKVECAVKLIIGSWESSGGGCGGDSYEPSSSGDRMLSFYSSPSPGQFVDLVFEKTEDTTNSSYLFNVAYSCKYFRFFKYRWGDKDLLRKEVVRAYLDNLH